MNTIEKTFWEKCKAAFIIFSIAWIISYHVSSIWAEWEDNILKQQAMSTPYTEYFNTYGVYFETWMKRNWVFSGTQAIVYMSDREIFQTINLNFSEKLYSDKDFDWDYNQWKVIFPPDINNKKIKSPRKMYRWELQTTCAVLWLGQYYVEHRIWTEVYWYTKEQFLYTYFTCIPWKQ